MSFFARLRATSSRIHILFYTAVKGVNDTIAQFGKDESNPDTMYLLAGNTLMDELGAVTTISRPQSKQGKMRSVPSQTSSLANSSPLRPDDLALDDTSTPSNTTAIQVQKPYRHYSREDLTFAHFTNTPVK